MSLPVLAPRDDEQDKLQIPAVQLFERLARDPSVDVDKLERLMQLHERATARWAKEQFDGAMSKAQKEMRPISADATNPQTKSKYASYEKLDNALRPIYTTHGFGLSFDTDECPVADHVRVVCEVTHEGGHSKRHHVDMPADGKGAKGGDVMTKTHAVGSALSYGMRYLLKMVFNVAVGEGDDDGNRASGPAAPTPDGYDNWLVDMALVADNGLPALQDAWNKSKNDYKVYVTKTDPQTWANLKAKAAKIKAVGR